MCIRDRCVSGKARWSLNNVVLPSKWSEKVRCGCGSDFKREKEVVIFKLNRSYEGLVKKLNYERIITNNKDLPCVVVNDGYIDVDDDKHLPWSRFSVLIVGDNCEFVSSTDIASCGNG